MPTDLLFPDALTWVARTALGLTFLLSGTGKLRDVDAFVAGALLYDVLPERVVRPLVLQW